MDVLERFNGWGIKAALSYLQNLLKGTDWPDVEGEQITAFDAANLSINGSGIVTVVVDTLTDGSTEILSADINAYMNTEGALIPILDVAPTSGTAGRIKLYGFDNSGTIELHVIYPDDTDKTLSSDSA